MEVVSAFCPTPPTHPYPHVPVPLMEREVMEYDEKNNCIRQTKRQNEVIQTIRNNTAKHNFHAHDVHYNKIRKKSKAKKPQEQERKRKKTTHSFSFNT